jgi:hypothetical protein
MRTNCDLTIYNQYLVSGVAKWQRTQITAPVGFAVLWENRKASNVIRSGLLAADQATIYIPFARGAAYLASKAWQALTVKTGFWTLQKGDIVVRGLVTDEIHDAVVSPPSAAFTVTMLKAKYDDVLVISSVDFMDAGSVSLHHWKVSAT